MGLLSENEDERWEMYRYIHMGIHHIYFLYISVIIITITVSD